MEVDKVLQEICSYSFTKENIVSFLLQESKKYSTLSLFKHMLLSVVDCESIELLISTFYHLEYGSNSLEEIVLCYHNREIKKTKKEITACFIFGTVQRPDGNYSNRRIGSFNTSA